LCGFKLLDGKLLVDEATIVWHAAQCGGWV
jgi:hypothetical protein